MEDHKLRYLQSFLKHNRNCRLEECIEKIRSWEERARRCYDEVIDLDSDEFAEMMLLDGIFVIQLFLLFRNPKWRANGDRIFGNPRMLYDVRRDMTLLENQMPFFAIDGLFKMVFGAHQKHMPGLLELAYGFFRPGTNIEDMPEVVMESEVQHFLDAIRLLYLPSVRKAPCESEEEMEFIPSATELVAAGVKLRKGKSKCLFDIVFKNEVLEIPQLKILYPTESCFRNIIAFEQCYYRNDSYLIDYMCFMDHLVNTPGDAKLLIDKGIIENWLGNDDAATHLINTLCRETFMRSNNAYFYSLRRKLVEHCQKPHNKWKTTFKRDYCSSPWTVLSVIAAMVLLTLTVVQTVCSLLSLK
ncbi:hypothetical protein BT93_L0589 [Corymbia citriodora subsp. variegata]|uniref:Uncharacterized protein n=1 Tax=Corymbia citriodora subsp. variegata TaxID=360336 RepID=A0A8T0CWV0_CORYI|nr:hypothetical protein BT93_L0589 [Corymbia citriodora subsp. variegata]